MVRWLRAGLLLCLAMAWMPASGAGVAVQHGMPIITLAALPDEARVTLKLIKRGGPFAYQRDGVVFGNYERMLPKRPRGYYHEYTVKTPGIRGRGARRIISGATTEYYYTADHYRTFKRIQESP